MIIVWVVLGLVAGMLGMAGALIGGVFAHGFGWQQDSHPEDLVLVMLGAMLALVIYWQLVETEDVGIGMIDHH